MEGDSDSDITNPASRHPLTKEFRDLLEQRYKSTRNPTWSTDDRGGALTPGKSRRDRPSPAAILLAVKVGLIRVDAAQDDGKLARPVLCSSSLKDTDDFPGRRRGNRRATFDPARPRVRSSPRTTPTRSKSDKLIPPQHPEMPT